MTVLELRFPVGRYHATPWGRHVNEGAVEWPPSPWRILRALIATWYLKAREIPEPTIRSLVENLSVLPSFRLPGASTSHTRHYMPLRNGEKTKVFDTFIQLPREDCVQVVWNIDLAPELAAALTTLAARFGYFGRAESLVLARVLDDVTQIKPNSLPLAEGASLPEHTELVRLLTAVTPSDYERWRAEFLASQPASEGKKNSPKKAKAPKTEIPDDLFNALHADTGGLQAAGWNLPPGAQYVNYIRPENAFTPTAKLRPLRSRDLPTVARYAVVSTVAPGIRQAISVADRVHKALCAGDECAPVFTGLGANQEPRGDHVHAHIFCEPNGERDAITHITVWAPMGFDEAARLSLRTLNKVWGHGGHDIRLVLHGIGQTTDFAECNLFEKSDKWRSLTPFVSTRHAKTFRDGRPKIDETGWQVGSAGHDLLRLLKLYKPKIGVEIKQIDERSGPFRFGNRHLRSLQFQTVRHNGGGSHGDEPGKCFQLTFSTPVQGPLALGYGCHFGLGLFVPVRSGA